MDVITYAILKKQLQTKASLVNGKVPEEQLPSYVDDVIEYASRDAFPEEGEEGKIYVALDTGYTYRWGGTEYFQIGGQDLSNYVDLTSDQTITGVKKFTSSIYLDTTNVTRIASASGSIYIYSNAGNVVTNSHLKPSQTNVSDLGSSTATWKDLYLGGVIDFGNNAKIRKDASARINIQFGGVDKITVGNTITDIATSLVPTNNGTQDIGSSNHTFKDLYLSGKVNVGASNNTTIKASSNGSLVIDRDGATIFNFGNVDGVAGTYYTFVSTTNSNLGAGGYPWRNFYLTGSIYGATYNETFDDIYTTINNFNEAGTTEIKWSKLLTFTLSANTTFTLETAKTNCLNEYKAIITNSGSSAIILTFPSGTKILTNDEDNVVISGNVISLAGGVTIECSLMNNNLVAINWDVQ